MQLADKGDGKLVFPGQFSFGRFYPGIQQHKDKLLCIYYEKWRKRK